jgi:hypothetical protein
MACNRDTFIYFYVYRYRLSPWKGNTTATYIVKCMSLIIDGVWIGNRIYLTLTDPWLQEITNVSPIQILYTSLEHELQSSRGWVDPVLRKCGRAETRTRDLWICSQKLWPLDQRGGLLNWNSCYISACFVLRSYRSPVANWFEILVIRFM